MVEGIQASRVTLSNSTAKYDQLTSKLSGLLGEMKMLVDETKAESITKLRTVCGSLENVESQMKWNYKNHETAFDAFKKQMSTTNATITNSLAECETVAKQIRSTEAEMVQVSNDNETHLMGNLNEMASNFEEQKNSLTDTVNKIFVQVENTCEMTRIDIDGDLHRMIGDINTEQERISANQFEYDDTMNTLQSTQNEFYDTLNADIDVCQKRLEKFHNDELQMYTPTGQTPAKREYKYPKQLAATSPHGKIINDYWRTHDARDLNCSAIISEVMKFARVFFF